MNQKTRRNRQRRNTIRRRNNKRRQRKTRVKGGTSLTPYDLGETEQELIQKYENILNRETTNKILKFIISTLELDLQEFNEIDPNDINFIVARHNAGILHDDRRFKPIRDKLILLGNFIKFRRDNAHFRQQILRAEQLDIDNAFTERGNEVFGERVPLHNPNPISLMQPSLPRR